MSTRTSQGSLPTLDEPKRCFGCFRPLKLCYCSTIPVVDNRTSVHILQHRRERSHPFNTARIVNLALQRSQLMVGHNTELADRFDQVKLSSGAGLLFPGLDARVLSELTPSEFPDELIVPDGTWHHVKTLLRDIPRLQELPRYCLAPMNPSRYRIRREPHAHGLSTLEAVVFALQTIEPDTSGFGRLLGTFDGMIDNQIKQGTSNWRENQRRRRGMPNVPRALTGDLKNIVIGYGEQEPGNRLESGNRSAVKPRLIYWTAIRPVSGERFQSAIDSPAFQNKSFMERLRLSPDEIRDTVSIDRFRDRWNAFLRPDDRVVVLHPSTANLLQQVQPGWPLPLILKAISVPAELDTAPAVEPCLSLDVSPTNQSRAQERLGIAIRRVVALNLAFRQKRASSPSE
jgi:DTW domain-containing protein YfiP